MCPMIPPGEGAPKRVLYITDFYEEEALMGVVEYARGQGWELIANMRFHGQFPSETEADGILATATTPRVREWLERWKGTPMVHLGIAYPDITIPWVDVDYHTAGRIGARHLMELGQVRHVFYTLCDGEDTLQIRNGFEFELLKKGLKPIRLDLTEALSDEIPRQQRLELLASHLKKMEPPLAVMTSDDRRSLEVVAACQIAGLRVPEDVAILGCENRRVEVEMSPVRLSSLDFNRRSSGKKAAETLGQLMAGDESVPKSCTVPPSGVVGRASTATFATGHPGITRSVIHLRDHFASPLKLADLAEIAGMSERYFREEFKRLVGHSPRHELMRSRMASATRLLRDTDFKLEAIAIESGLGSAKKLCEFFPRFYGMSPHRWRLQALGQKSSPVR